MLDRFMQLPAPAQLGIAGAGGGIVVGSVTIGVARPGAVPWLIGGLLIVVLLVGIVFLGWRFLRARREKGLMDELGRDAVREPTGASAERRAELDRMRTEFLGGVTKLRETGVSIADKPWFLVIGAPSSGKTEMIRRSELSFPDGLTNRVQGVGGTLDMHWWFSREAILIDTAGRLTFGTEQSDRDLWSSFLDLLKKHRRHTPINGLIVALPVAELATDSADKTRAKAEMLAEQLRRIRRTLGVRFPVYVIVTKSDQLVGFKPFFRRCREAEQRWQMLGWSNPASLDDTYEGSVAGAAIDGLVERLETQRTRILAEDVAQIDPEAARRADACDELFAFPEAVGRLAPRLRTYLDEMFGEGAYDQKARPFLRGIYLTSAIQKDTAVDEAIFDAVGLTSFDAEAEEVEDTRAMFIYDLLTKKVIEESGLVTSAQNVGRSVRRRQLSVAAAGTAFILAFGGLTAWGYGSWSSSLSQSERYWRSVGSELGTLRSRSLTRVKGDHALTLVQVEPASSDGDPATISLVERFGDPDVDGLPLAPTFNEASVVTSPGGFAGMLESGRSLIESPPRVPLAFRFAAAVFGDHASRAKADEQGRAYATLVDETVIAPLVEAAMEGAQSGDITLGPEEVDALNRARRVVTWEPGADPLDRRSELDRDTVSVLVRLALGDDPGGITVDAIAEPVTRWIETADRVDASSATERGERLRQIARSNRFDPAIKRLERPVQDASDAMPADRIDTIEMLLSTMDQAEEDLAAAASAVAWTRAAKSFAEAGQDLRKQLALLPAASPLPRTITERSWRNFREEQERRRGAMQLAVAEWQQGSGAVVARDQPEVRPPDLPGADGADDEDEATEGDAPETAAGSDRASILAGRYLVPITRSADGLRAYEPLTDLRAAALEALSTVREVAGGSPDLGEFDEAVTRITAVVDGWTTLQGDLPAEPAMLTEAARAAGRRIATTADESRARLRESFREAIRVPSGPIGQDALRAATERMADTSDVRTLAGELTTAVGAVAGEAARSAVRGPSGDPGTTFAAMHPAAIAALLADLDALSGPDPDLALASDALKGAASAYWFGFGPRSVLAEFSIDPGNDPVARIRSIFERGRSGAAVAASARTAAADVRRAARVAFPDAAADSGAPVAPSVVAALDALAERSRSESRYVMPPTVWGSIDAAVTDGTSRLILALFGSSVAGDSEPVRLVGAWSRQARASVDDVRKSIERFERRFPLTDAPDDEISSGDWDTLRRIDRAGVESLAELGDRGSRLASRLKLLLSLSDPLTGRIDATVSPRLDDKILPAPMRANGRFRTDVAESWIGASSGALLVRLDLGAGTPQDLVRDLRPASVPIHGPGTRAMVLRGEDGGSHVMVLSEQANWGPLALIRDAEDFAVIGDGRLELILVPSPDDRTTYARLELRFAVPMPSAELETLVTVLRGS